MQKALFGVVQMNSVRDVQTNLKLAESAIRQAAERGVQFLVLPEMFACMAERLSEQLRLAEVFGHGPIQDFLAQQAARHGLWLVGGTMPIQTGRPNFAYASCLLYNPQGECASRYDKVHLFDVRMRDGKESYNESDVFLPGRKTICADTPWGPCGIAVCYDLRFPEMFRRLVDLGAKWVVLPSAFTYTTGKAHWEVLVRARAIENQIYLLAANQVGEHAACRRTYGHSMIVSPWGEVLNRVDHQPGAAYATIDFQAQKTLRDGFPCLQHRVL